MTNKQKVLAAHPNAKCFSYKPGHFVVVFDGQTAGFNEETTPDTLLAGGTSSAWSRAARHLT